MRKRIEFVFSPDAAALLESLKERTGASSYGEVIRNAMRVYEWIRECDKVGLGVAAIRAGEIVHVVKLL